ncbi:MAG: synthase, epsilon subunit, partial [Acidimicrobiaceae bacterium]|nr:synthase, epsilon subunit [Acidimicrobiaceae bacterium]
MATAFHAEVVTPERVLFSGDADEVMLRTDEGEIAFLAHHSEFVGAVDITVVAVSALGSTSESGGTAPTQERAGAESTGDPKLFAVHGGFVHVADNVVTVLAGVAERGDEIDVARARAALSAARDRLGTEGIPTAPDARPAPQSPGGA